MTCIIVSSSSPLLIFNHYGKIDETKQSEQYRLLDINDYVTSSSEYAGLYVGYIHNNDNESNKIMNTINNAYNICVDVLDFKPRTTNEIIISQK